MPARAPSSHIYPLAKVVNEQNLSMGEYATIDDFAFVNAGRRLALGRYVHVAAHASIIGGGECELGDYAVLATGARILTATDTFRGGARMSTHLPASHRAVLEAPVLIARDAFVGANAVVMPGVTIGEGAVVGAGAVVTSDLQSWTVYAGVPARRIGERPCPTSPGP